MREAGKETAEYEAFPGMKFELGAQVVSTGSSFEECEYTCSREQEGCAAFSYSASKKVCMKTAEQLHYSTKFNYYEKTGLSPGERKINKENWKKKKSFTKRQNLLKNDKQEDQATQMVEIKSKQQQIADLKVSLGHQQKIAQQDRVNERTTKKFNRVLRENGVKTEQKALAAQQAAAKSKQEEDAKKKAQAAAANAQLAVVQASQNAAEEQALTPLNITATNEEAPGDDEEAPGDAEGDTENDVEQTSIENVV